MVTAESMAVINSTKHGLDMMKILRIVILRWVLCIFEEFSAAETEIPV